MPGTIKKQDVVAREEPTLEGYVLISRTDALVRYPVREGTTKFGRSEENDVVILHPAASRHHASACRGFAATRGRSRSMA